jgi:hypothetical protein
VADVGGLKVFLVVVLVLVFLVVVLVFLLRLRAALLKGLTAAADGCC